MLFRSIGKGIYPIVLSNWHPDYYDPDTFIQPFLSCQSGDGATGCKQGASQANGSFYYNPQANKLVIQQQGEQEPAARAALLGQLQDLAVKDVPYIPLWQNKDYVFAKAGFKHVSIEPTQQFLLWPIARS